VLPLIKPERDAAHLLAHPTARRRLQEAMEGFDAVIIDAPPVLPLADSNLLADLVDGFIFVVKAEQTPQRLITSALKCVPKNKMFGFVLNNAQLFGRAAYGHHYYGAGYFDMSAKP
jgi:Mrp family chromosome partitioning ATPase